MQKKLKGIISNPNLAPYIKQSVVAYQEAGLLRGFYTSFCVSSAWETRIKFLPRSWCVFLGRRAFKELDGKLLHSSGFSEILRVLATKFGSAKLADQVWEWSEKRFDRKVAKEISEKATFFHGYEHACLASLQVAKALGVPTFYEQPSQHHAYFTSIVEKQVQQHPSLKSEATALLNDEKAQRRNKRRDEELKLCDYVICNSSFTKKTLLEAGIATEKVMVIPYGYPTVQAISVKDKKIFHFIYAGNLSLRKGVHLLLKAWKMLPPDLPVFLTLMGSRQLPDVMLSQLPQNVSWIPNLPYESAQQKIAESNMLVLPTLADGFGMVISESMAMGVPVLTTEASAGPDLVDNYIDGIVIPADDVEALREALLWCATHVEECEKMGKKAQEKASTYPWRAYREKLVKEINKKLDGKS
jgi:glycosyltransferase involved in cell wall biosynthesis